MVSGRACWSRGGHLPHLRSNPRGAQGNQRRTTQKRMLYRPWQSDSIRV